MVGVTVRSRTSLIPKVVAMATDSFKHRTAHAQDSFGTTTSKRIHPSFKKSRQVERMDGDSTKSIFQNPFEPCKICAIASPQFSPACANAMRCFHGRVRELREES
jgi:hypothetical protein